MLAQSMLHSRIDHERAVLDSDLLMGGIGMQLSERAAVDHSDAQPASTDWRRERDGIQRRVNVGDPAELSRQAA
jgi:hypothetical protein